MATVNNHGEISGQQINADNIENFAINNNSGSDSELLKEIFTSLVAAMPEAKESLEILKVEAEKPEPDVKVAEKEKEKLVPLGEKIGGVLGKLAKGVSMGFIKSNPITAMLWEISEEFQK